jgi:hypothetical protein
LSGGRGARVSPYGANVEPLLPTDATGWWAKAWKALSSGNGVQRLCPPYDFGEV